MKTMLPRRLYIDNAATSFPKPESVLNAMMYYAQSLGASAGRGAYSEAIETAGILSECRLNLKKHFNGERAEHFVFTLNCTEALNIAIKGLIDPSKDNHVICTAIDHNSILRPTTAMEDAGLVHRTIVPISASTGLVDPDDIRKAIRPTTRFIAVTHASNVTGTVQPLAEIGRMAREHAIPFIVDAAQSVGHMKIDVQRDCIDLLASPGHKALLGPLGTGFLYLRPGMEKIVKPLFEGGTGSVSEEPRQPTFMPDRYESGSHNAIGIAGLNAGLEWIAEKGIDALHKHDLDLVQVFVDGVSNIEGLTYYGPRGVKDRVGVFSVRIDGYEPHELSAVLESSYGILTRSGIHCAPLAHETIGTSSLGGTTRFSFGPFVTMQDVKFATDALAEIAMNRVTA